MNVNHSANFTDFVEFMAALEKIRATGIALNFNGNINASENDNDNFSVNWTSDEEV